MRSYSAFFLLALSAAALAADPEPPVRPSARFQYAELVVGRTPATTDGAGNRVPGKQVYRWVTSKGKVEGDSWEDLAKKLKVPEPPKDAEVEHKLRVLDHLGRDGWEYVGVLEEAATTRSTGFGKEKSSPNSGRPLVTWSFKRKLGG